MIFLTESPRWLVTKGRIAAAEKAMCYLSGGSSRNSERMSADCRTDLNAIIKEYELTKANHTEQDFFKIISRPEVYRPLAMIFGLFLFQQFTGVYLILVYAVKFCLEAGVEIDPFLCAVGIGMARVVASLIAGNVLDRCGRKLSTIMSCSVMGICMFTIGVYLRSGSSFAAWLPVLCIFTHVFMSSFGLCIVPWLYMGEIFPQQLRAISSGISAVGMTVCSFTVIKLYPTMLTVMGSENLFFFFGATSVMTVIFVIFILPETKNKSLEEIQQMFRQKESK